MSSIGVPVLCCNDFPKEIQLTIQRDKAFREAAEGSYIPSSFSRLHVLHC